MTLVAGPASDNRGADSPPHLQRLEMLAGELAGQGMRTQLVTPPGKPPSLHVANPGHSRMAEDVYAWPGKDGVWWFWWPWVQQIARGDEPAVAAALIAHVLSVHQPGSSG